MPWLKILYLHFFYSFLLKPFSYEELLCRINQNIDMLEYVECIQNTANRDYLTRLYNRRYFFQVGETIYDEAKENKVAVIRTPSGYTLSAIVDGEISNLDSFKKLPEETQKEYNSN